MSSTGPPNPQGQQVTFDARYVGSLLLDKSNIAARDYATGLDLLRNYSKIPEEEITSHVADIQRRAYAICPYPCIGLLRFLICSLSEHPLYPIILTRLHQNATFVDLGCCFAQDIRKLAYDGAPTSNCKAIDLEPRFFDLAEALFKDKGRLQASFLGADIFNQEDETWAALEGQTDIVHASSFFHLFGLAKQKRIALFISSWVRPVPGSLVLGLQLAARGKPEHIPVVNEGEPTFCHSLESMQSLWDEAGKAAGLGRSSLRWKVDLKERDVPKSHRIGLLRDERLREVLWTAELVEDKDLVS